MTYEGASHRLRTSGTETRFDRWLRAARQGLEGVLFVMSKEVHGHKNWSIFGMWFDFFQLMAYPLYQGKAFPWRKMPVMTGVISFLGSLNPSAAADQVSPMFKLFTVFIAAAWVAAIIAAAAYSAYAFSIGNFATVAPLKFLRATARLTTAVLFVPLASLLISVYKCNVGEMWSITDIPCYGTEHTLLVALISVLLPFFWIFSLCVSAVFFDRNYRSSNIVARAHGRVAIAMISVKSLLTLVFTVAGDTEPWFLHIFVVAVGFLWLWLWITFLPNMTQWYNRTWAAFGGVFTWAALCAALAKLLDDPKSGVAGYVFLIGVPTAAYSGYALAYMRFQSFGRVGTPGGPSLRSAYDVDLRARWLMKDIMAAAQGSDASHGSHKVKARAIQPLRNRSAGRSSTVGRQQLGSAGRLAQTGGAYGAASRSLSPSRASQYGTSAADTPARRAVSQTPVRSTPLVMQAGGRGGSLPGNGDTMIVVSQGQAGNPTLVSPPKLVKNKSFSTTDSGDSTSDSGSPRASQWGASGGGGTGTGVIPYAGTGIDWSAAFNDGDETGSHASKQGKHSEQAIVAQVADLYATASSSMPGSSVLNLFHAQFIRVFVGDRDLELAIINQGLEKDPSIDIRFLLFQSRKQLEETPSGQPPPGAPGSGHDGHEGGGGHGKGGGHHGHGAHGHGHHKSHHTKLTLIERVQFEKLQGESVEFDLKARQAELHFWTQLRSPRPSLPRLHELAEEMSDSIAACTTAYERMLVMRPDSIEVLNAYAVFLLEVKRETTLANRYFDAAEELLAKHEAAEEAARQKAEAAHAAAEAMARQQAEMAYMMSLVTPSHAGGRGGGGGDERRNSTMGMFAVASAVSKFKNMAAAHHRNSLLGSPSGFLPGVNPKAGGANTLAMGADGQLRDARGGVLFAMDAARRAQAAAWFANGGGMWDAEGTYSAEVTTSTAGMLSARPDDLPAGSPSHAAAPLGSASAAQHTGAVTHAPFLRPSLNTSAPAPRAGLGMGFGVTPSAGMATAVTPAHGHANATGFGSSSSHHMVPGQQHHFSGHQFMPNGPVVPGMAGTLPPALATSPRALQNAIAAHARQQGALSPTGGLRSAMASHRSAGFAPPTLATPAVGFAAGMGNAFSPRGGAGNLTSRTQHSSGNALSSPLHTSRHSNGNHGAAANSSKTDDGHEAMFAKNRRGSAAITAYASAIAKVRRASLVAATAADISSGRSVSEKQHAQRRASVDANMIWNAATPRPGAAATTLEALTARASEAMRGESAWAAPGTARKKESDGDRTARNAGDTTARRQGAGSPPPPASARKAKSEDPKPKQRRPSLLIPGAAGQLATDVDADKGKTGGRASARDGAAPLAAAGAGGAKQRRTSIQPTEAAKLAVAAKNEEAAAKEEAAKQAALEEEQNRDRLDKEELEAVKRSAGVSNRAKAEARARKKDAAEAAAASLRMAIKAKAGVAEPSLLLLRRALTVLFGLAAVLNMVGAVVQRSLLEAFSKDMDLLALAVERQLLAEDILRHTHNLVLMNAGVLPRFGAGSGGSALLTANKTYGAISRAAARMDELHRILYMSSSSAAATPEDKELYNRAMLSVRDYSAPTASRPSGAFTTRSLSLSNLGVEYIGKAGLLVGQQLENITAGEVVGLDHPPASLGGVNSNAWYILSNGPGPLRAALNQSTLELADRADNHAQLLQVVDFALAVGSAILTCCVALIVVLPIVGAVKSSTDEIFAIFLALPDVTLKQMERTCKQQITALEKLLAASNVDMQAEQVLVVAINDIAAEVGGDSDEDGSGDDTVSDVEGHSKAAAQRKKKSPQDGDGLDLDKDIQQVDYSEENEVDGSQAAGGSVLFGRGERRRPGTGHEQSALLSGPVAASEDGSAISIRRDGPEGHVQTTARSTDELASEAASKAIQLTRASSKAQMVAQQGRGPMQVPGRTLKPTPSVLEMKTDRERVALIRQMSSALLPGMRAIEEEEVAAGNGTPEPGSGKASATGRFSIMQPFRALSRLGSREMSAFSSFLLPAGGQGGKKRTSSSREVGISKKGSLAARQFDSSFMMLFKLAARFAWPLVALGAYYGGLWSYEEGTTRALVVLTHAAKYFGQVHVLLAQIDQGVRTLIASAPPVASPSIAFSCNATHLASVLAQADSTIATANVYQDALLFGNAERGFRTAALTLDPALLNIMLRDGCSGVASMPDDCADRRGFYNGLVGDGLQPALRQFMSLARYTLQLRQDALAQSVMIGGPCPAGVDMSVQPVSDLTGLANTYLRASFYRVLDIVLGLGRARVSGFVAGHAAMAAVSIILLFFVYMFWILRSIRKMDRDIKRTRGTLLLFPTDVLAGVATFVQMAGGLGSGGAVKAMQDKAGDDAFDSAVGGRLATSPLAAMGKAFASAKSTLVNASGRALSGGDKKGLDRKASGKKKTVEAKPIFMGLSRAQRGSSFVAGQTPGQAGVYAVSAAAGLRAGGGRGVGSTNNLKTVGSVGALGVGSRRNLNSVGSRKDLSSLGRAASKGRGLQA